MLQPDCVDQHRWRVPELESDRGKLGPSIFMAIINSAVQRLDVCDIFSVGPRFKLFDGSGIKNYVDPKEVYLIASDGRMLKRSTGNDVGLIDPNLLQDGSAKVCGRLRVL